MAKMKINERKDYGLGKNDVITYKRSNIPRQLQFMILRGPGLNVQEAIQENEGLKALAVKKRFKLKFMQAQTSEDLVAHLKDANVWAKGGVIFNLGELEDENQAIKKAVDRILIPVIEVREGGKVSSMLDGIELLLK